MLVYGIWGTADQYMIRASLDRMISPTQVKLPLAAGFSQKLWACPATGPMFMVPPAAACSRRSGAESVERSGKLRLSVAPVNPRGAAAL